MGGRGAGAGPSSKQKPIFLSIGYAACHWCHVMAHESFEDAEIARLLNEHFVSIKVDREERPDLDQIYMEAVQMMTGRGGWPMSVFLTPECEPFFGGTYWPPRARDGMPGFDQVLQAIADAWQHRRQDLLEQAERITQLLRNRSEQVVGCVKRTSRIRRHRLVRCTHPTISRSRGKRPKRRCGNRSIRSTAVSGRRRNFPNRWPCAGCWAAGGRSGDGELLHMVATTLDRMAAGGLFDQLGGGFHRYSVDARWLAPHFEKMLYDNAMLAVCYLEAWQATGEDQYAAVARQTLDYLLRDMTDPQGGFYSSEDADSEGEEGKFYLWTPGEIEAVLGPESARVVLPRVRRDRGGQLRGPKHPAPVAAVGDRGEDARPRAGATGGRIGGCPAAAAGGSGAVASGRAATRKCWSVGTAWPSRPWPERGPRCRAAYTAAAGAAADFLLAHLRRNDKRLLHYWRDGRAKYDAYLDDYAGLACALLTLYEAGGPPAWLDQAVGLADEILARFADREHGGFFFTAVDHEPLLVRKKDVIDNPVPSGNGLAAMLFLRLHAICRRDDYRAAAEATLRACLPWMRQVADRHVPVAAGDGLSDRQWNEV